MLVALVQAVIVLVVIGAVLYLVETYIPMPDGFKVVIRVIAILALCLWLLSFLGLAGGWGRLG